jgi:hypothetical protein
MKNAYLTLSKESVLVFKLEGVIYKIFEKIFLGEGGHSTLEIYIKYFFIRTKKFNVEVYQIISSADFVRLFSYLLHSEARCIGTRMFLVVGSSLFKCSPRY